MKGTIRQKGFTISELLIVMVVIIGFGGWVNNIVTIVETVADPITGMFILRCIGIVFVPLGVVLGFM